MNKQTSALFAKLDQRMLDLQERLCASKHTHRADQVDILRKGLSTIFGEMLKERDGHGKTNRTRR